MKIVKIYTLKSRGAYAKSEHWKKTRRQIHDAIKSCEWPVGSGTFTIYPESGKERGAGNGVKPIRDGFVKMLRDVGWQIEGKAKNALNESLGDFDAALPSPEQSIVVEWDKGNASSSHLSMNKLTLLLKTRLISAGMAVLPSRKLMEIEPYFDFWRSVRCHEGVLEVVVIEYGTE
jgi:hypothetical protein